MAAGSRLSSIGRAGLSERELQVLAAAFASLKDGYAVDWAKFAPLAGYASIDSARVCFRPVQKKLNAYLDSAVGGDGFALGGGGGSGGSGGRGGGSGGGSGGRGSGSGSGGGDLAAAGGDIPTTPGPAVQGTPGTVRTPKAPRTPGTPARPRGRPRKRPRVGDDNKEQPCPEPKPARPAVVKDGAGDLGPFVAPKLGPPHTPVQKIKMETEEPASAAAAAKQTNGAAPEQAPLPNQEFFRTYAEGPDFDYGDYGLHASADEADAPFGALSAEEFDTI